MNLSEFINAAKATKINDGASFNWRVEVECEELESGVIDVSATDEYDAVENAYLYVIDIRERNLTRN